MNNAGVNVRRLGESRTLRVLDGNCLGCQCFDPQIVVGPRGQPIFTCLSRVREVCPKPGEKGYSDKLLTQRQRDGWRELDEDG